METHTDRTFFQAGDRVRLKQTGATGTIDAADGGVVYVVMDKTKEAQVFSAAVDEDALIELVLPEGESQKQGALKETVPSVEKQRSAPPRSAERGNNNE